MQNRCSKIDKLREFVSFNFVQNLEYVNFLVCEALRFRPPAPMSTDFLVTKDVKILDKYIIKAGDLLAINYKGLHFDIR